jgi:hypothetical protein
MKSQGHGKLRQCKAKTLKAKGRRELGGERAPRVGEKQGMAGTRGMNPFLKANFPARAPKHHGQGLPRRAPGFLSYDTGPGLTCHTSWPEARRRRTATQGACNRPAVMRPFIFAMTNGQEGEPPHKERVTTPRLCAPSSSPRPTVKKANRRTRSVLPPRGNVPPRLHRSQRSSLWHGGPGPHVMYLACRFWYTKKSHRPSHQYHASSGPPQKTEKIGFQNQCSDSRHPAHGPTKPLSAEVTGQLAAEAGVADSVTKGGSAAITPTGAQKQRTNDQPKFGPTCRLVSSSKAARGPLSVP